MLVELALNTAQKVLKNTICAVFEPIRTLQHPTKNRHGGGSAHINLVELGFLQPTDRPFNHRFWSG
jgi:hypothetical protein